MKKYKLTLLKDLPDTDAGTTINITDEELSSSKYHGEHRDIFALRNNEKWVKIEEDTRCDCMTHDFISFVYKVIGYGRELSVGISFTDREIYCYYDHACDSGRKYPLPIKYCPLCGRELPEVIIRRY